LPRAPKVMEGVAPDCHTEQDGQSLS
jgi:hypothetical protein